MFDGRDKVRMLPGQRYDDDVELASKALETACRPQDRYAWAAEIFIDESDMWIVTAACEQ